MKFEILSTFTLAALASFSGIANAQTSAIRCYVSNNNGTTEVFQTPGGNTICLTYQYPCTQVSTTCTSSDVSARTVKTISTFAYKDVCDLMKSEPASYSNVQCCSTDLCNSALTGTNGNGNQTRAINGGERISATGLVTLVLPALALLL